MVTLGIDKNAFILQEGSGMKQSYICKQILTYGVSDIEEDIEVIHKTGKDFEDTCRDLQEDEINKFIVLFVDIWGNEIRLQFKDYDIIYIGVYRIK